MTAGSHRIAQAINRIKPGEATTILEPEVGEDGYWAGCPGVLYEPENDRFLMTYRQRRPRGATADRGWRCVVAESADGENFTDIWAVEKHELNSPSMERFSLISGSAGGYQLYFSYVDPADGRWRIDVCDADKADGFDVTSARPVLSAASTGTEGIKDPYVMQIGPVTYVFASYANPFPADAVNADEAHATADVYTTGVTTHPSGVATSVDGVNFNWHGPVMETGAGWDRYQTRLNSILPLNQGYLGFYDGASSAAENYEEKTGLAVSHDLMTWRSVTPDGPWVDSQEGSGSVRYLDAVATGSEWLLYYEVSRDDGAHDLRLTRLPRP